MALDVQIGPPKEEREWRWLYTLWQQEWGGETMVSRGHVYRLADLDSLVAKIDGEMAGAATYRMDGVGGCELMSINATRSNAGVGTRLLEAVERAAREAGCRRVWLITSNDNLNALRFYQRRGYRMTALYPGAIDEARRIKPTIPLIGNDGIEIHDELELAKALA
ncbi:GNAT family N-acetyltransferase [Alicyclobacillus kakegawensis]|uniref:GNAT family N-acetyltransferase n=1 Tax=Alicyclobacillus kakegawensis TaxID=392012 RepID=UPI000B25E800|nr:GNAT family N-acetyltransferase [Alicyclobacillus kakegawensis]